MTYQELEAIYARMPSANCQRKCQEACGPIPLTKLEYVRITGKQPPAQPLIHGHPVMINPVTGSCPRLGRDGNCRSYKSRPTICRLYGVVRAMSCEFGCVPDRWLTDEEARAILKAVEQLCEEATA